MFDKLKQLGELKKMRDQAMQIQKQLDEEVIELEKGDMKVRISAAQKIKTIEIAGELQDRLVDLLNEAIKKSQEIAAKKMQSAMGGMEGLKGLLGR